MNASATMSELPLSRSARKFIRREKERIRGQVFDSQKRDELIADLYKKLLGEKTAVAEPAGSKVQKEKEIAEKPKADKLKGKS